MSDVTLTNEEKRCLQMWFRQALIQVERKEAAAALTQWMSEDDAPSHRPQIAARRVRRGPHTAHIKEFV